MRSVVGYVVSVLILLAAGVALLVTGRMEQRLIEGRRQLLTLQRPDADEPGGVARFFQDTLRLPWISARTGEVREQRATSDYWQRNYPALTPVRDASGTIVEQDPTMLLLAANAAYRRHTCRRYRSGGGAAAGRGPRPVRGAAAARAR